jgi:hypothetical protein
VRIHKQAAGSAESKKISTGNALDSYRNKLVKGRKSYPTFGKLSKKPLSNPQADEQHKQRKMKAFGGLIKQHEDVLSDVEIEIIEKKLK